MAYHTTKLWELQEKVKEIHRKIAFLLEESNLYQRQILLEAQRSLAEWEKTHVHTIRKAFEESRANQEAF